MKKLFYLSKFKLQFNEIGKSLSKKMTFLKPSLIIPLLTVSVILIIITSFALLGNGNSSLKKQNLVLKDKLAKISFAYSILDKQLDSLIQKNNQLRIAANLPVLSKEEEKIGVGGGFFDNSFDFSGKDIRTLSSYVDEISRKIQFEKNNFNVISGKIEDNRKMFESIPAIKPCDGIVSEHGFGMRIHPILNINMMHDGIDIITEIGTPVHASGKGTIDFIGYRGGYGLAVEVDHGFGYRTLYAHLSAVKVKMGQSVKRGDIIAQTGNSGLSSGPHLHYEVSRDGIKQDPSYFFFEETSNSKLAKIDGR